MDTRSHVFFNKATNKLELAKEEIFKPLEDIVSYSVCKNSQFAIENFLKGFLIHNNVKIEATETIASLYEKCVAFDKDFQNIDISSIGCKKQPIDSRYCSEIDSVSACYDTADAIDTYLRKIKLI